MMQHEIHIPDTFLYFTYSANMLTFRVQMFSENAEFVSIGRLDNYRLDFNKYNKFWGGPTPTMVPTANAHIWGVIWRMHTDNLISLDDLKGVDIKSYFVKYVDILTPYMGTFICRAYMQREYPLPRGNREPIPVERWPSWSYKEIMIMGAKEHGLPLYYIRFLRKLKHNGEEGGIRTLCMLIRYGKLSPCGCTVPNKILRKPLKFTTMRLKEEYLTQKVIQSQVEAKNPARSTYF